jgi:hypothetical protein
MKMRVTMTTMMTLLTMIQMVMLWGGDDVVEDYDDDQNSYGDGDDACDFFSVDDVDDYDNDEFYAYCLHVLLHRRGWLDPGCPESSGTPTRQRPSL